MEGLPSRQESIEIERYIPSGVRGRAPAENEFGSF